MRKQARTPTLEYSNTIIAAVFILGLMLQSQGYCADTSAEAQQIDAVTTGVMNTIFSPGIKKAALALGAGAGIFQSWMGGSIKPLLLWGGLGMAVNYVPRVVEMIANL